MFTIDPIRYDWTVTEKHPMAWLRDQPARREIIMLNTMQLRGDVAEMMEGDIS